MQEFMPRRQSSRIEKLAKEKEETARVLAKEEEERKVKEAEERERRQMYGCVLVNFCVLLLLCVTSTLNYLFCLIF